MNQTKLVYDEVSVDMRDTFFDNYGVDNEAALHAAYCLITYLEAGEWHLSGLSLEGMQSNGYLDG